MSFSSKKVWSAGSPYSHTRRNSWTRPTGLQLIKSQTMPSRQLSWKWGRSPEITAQSLTHGGQVGQMFCRRGLATRQLPPVAGLPASAAGHNPSRICLHIWRTATLLMDWWQWFDDARFCGINHPWLLAGSRAITASSGSSSSSGMRTSSSPSSAVFPLRRYVLWSPFILLSSRDSEKWRWLRSVLILPVKICRHIHHFITRIRVIEVYLPTLHDWLRLTGWTGRRWWKLSILTAADMWVGTAKLDRRRDKVITSLLPTVKWSRMSYSWVTPRVFFFYIVKLCLYGELRKLSY